MSDPLAFGAKLRSMRKKKGWTLAYVAERTQLAEPYISQLETGVRVPSWATMEALARAFDVPKSKLLEGT